MKHPVTRELFTYWSRLRGSRSAPERNDIDPAAIRAVLSDAFILDVERSAAAQAYPLRLSGTRLNALFLSELKDKSLPELWQKADREDLLDMLAAVSDDCAPVVAGLKAGPAGHRPIDLEMILLPLRHQGRTHARLLGAIAPIEVPSWLGLLPVQSFSISSWRLIDSGAAAHCLSPTIPYPAPRRYGPLLLHQGGRQGATELRGAR